MASGEASIGRESTTPRLRSRRFVGPDGGPYDDGMSARIIDGKAVAATIRAELRKEVASLRDGGVVPRLAILLAGDDAASLSYVTAKQRAAAEVGIDADLQRIPGEGDPREVEAEIARRIDALNADPALHGMILQLPVPDGVDSDGLLRRIDPRKDVDALHPENQGRIVIGQARYYPATPHGVQQLLVRDGADPGGKHVVIVGRSRLVGLPLAAMLLQKRAGANATVTVCHTRTPDLGAVTRTADILVAAAGQPAMITADMVRPGAVVIDVGVNRVDDATRKRGYRLAGDVDFPRVSEVAGAITPVPGGVGPMTVTMLLANVARAARLNK